MHRFFDEAALIVHKGTTNFTPETRNVQEKSFTHSKKLMDHKDNLLKVIDLIQRPGARNNLSSPRTFSNLNDYQNNENMVKNNCDLREVFETGRKSDLLKIANPSWM
jgi:hypothetical protein